MHRLLAVSGGLAGKSFPLAESCVIGRDPSMAVSLPETTASRRHAELIVREGEYRIRDCGSHNGTFVNGKKVEEKVLVPGDTILIGDHTFLFLRDGMLASTVAPSSGFPPRRFQVDSQVEEFEMVGDSAPLRECLAAAERMAPADAPVLLTGETGTGKELISRWIHRASPRAAGPFVAVNCAAIPESLFEAELFGAEKGAFTGAGERRAGKFELASGGTLFLDEIGELPTPLQSKLLRAVQEKTFFRVGGSKEIRTDVRIIAATNRNLKEAVRKKTFREDLYHRISTLLLRVPPLRERKGDIPLLARHIAHRAARKLGKPFSDFAPEGIERLRGYDWPGNIRELQNVVERAVILTRHEVIEPRELQIPASSFDSELENFSLEASERKAIARAIERTGGKRMEAAKLLGIAVPTLRRKLRLYDMDDGTE